jgi:membrane fusion protein (multidrug efflux system)
MNKTGKRTITYLVIILVIILLAIPKLKGLWSKDKDKQADAKPAAQTQVVDAMVITQDTLNHVLNLSGTVLPDEQVDIKPEVAGRIIKINFEEGSRVRKGQLLIKLNNADLLAQLSKLESDKQTAADKLDRDKQLIAKEAISKEDYENDANNLAGINANIKNLQAQLAKMEIYAPFDGTIGLRLVSEGSYISPTPTMKIATLTRINPVKVDFFVPGQYAYKIQNGQDVHFKVQGAQDSAYTAKVYAVEPHIDVTSRSLEVRAIYPNKHNELYPGAFAQIDLPLDKTDEAILVPNNALVPNAKGAMVYLYKSGQAQPQQVSVGMRTESDIQLLDGVKPGDTVIVSGIIQMKPGVKVSVNIKH